jgi:hypothetical protein
MARSQEASMKSLATAFWMVATVSACGPAAQGESTAVQVAINEVMASNQNAIADEAGDYDDWIELYNATDQTVDLEGYFVSDDPDDPFKRRLPAGLQIEAGKTLLLWADGDVDQGPNHLPFKLAAAGELVLLTDPDGAAIDSIEFSNAVADKVFGRYPDAKGAMIECATPTPDLKNGDACGES